MWPELGRNESDCPITLFNTPETFGPKIDGCAYDSAEEPPDVFIYSGLDGS